MDVAHLLVEAEERTAKLRQLRALLPAPSAPLMFNDRDPGALNGISPDEAAVVRVLRAGAGSLAELTEQLPLDEATLGSAVLGLRDRGAILIPGAGAAR